MRFYYWNDGTRRPEVASRDPLFPIAPHRRKGETTEAAAVAVAAAALVGVTLASHASIIRE